MMDEAAEGQRRPAPARRSASAAPAVTLALDLGGTHLRAAAVASDGRLLARTSGPSLISEGPEATISAAVTSLRTVRAEVEPAGARLTGIGISAPGPLDPKIGTLLDPPNLGEAFHDLPLAARIAAEMDLPVVLDRDTQVAALAEGRYGAARGTGDFVYLTVSTGIGGAVVSDGRLLTGPDGVAGELGHLTVDLNGPLCGCGAVGHLEAIASGTGIARLAATAVARDPAGALAALAQQRAPEPLNARDVATLELEGDPTASALMDHARVAFASAVVSIVDIFNPDLVVVGGAIAQAQADRLLQPAREAVRATAFRAQAHRVRIVLAELGDDVSLVGAVPLVEARLPGARAPLAPAPAVVAVA